VDKVFNPKVVLDVATDVFPEDTPPRSVYALKTAEFERSLDRIFLNNEDNTVTWRIDSSWLYLGQ